MPDHSAEMVDAITRSCGTCSLCCKVYDIAAVPKPAGRWCRHCVPGRGCAAYEERPATCVDFTCEWLRNEDLGPLWRPDVAKFVIVRHDDDRTLQITCDAGQPDAWRKPPYEPQIRRWAVQLAPLEVLVLVMHRGAATLVRPGEPDLPLGVLGPDGVGIGVRAENTPLGPRLRIA